MLYESSKLMRELKRWNKLFRRQGFQVVLELPGQNTKMGDGWETEEEKKQLRTISKRFRILITPNAEKGAGVSIYSRNSSLTKAISGEGAATTITKVPTIEFTRAQEEAEGEGDEDEDEEGDGFEDERQSRGDEFSGFDYSRPEGADENGDLSATTSPQERPISPQLARKKKKRVEEPPPPDNAGIPLVVQQMLARAAAQKEKEANGY